MESFLREARYALVASTAIACAAFLALAASPSTAQPAGLEQKVVSWVTANQRAIVTELVDLLAIPNVAADRANIRKNATRLQEMLTRRGLTAEILETTGNPLVWGEMKAAGATRTLLIYAHYDGQPVNNRDWRQPSPFTPILRAGRMEDNGAELADLATRATFDADQRIYARSASDDKSPIVALLAAFDALKANGLRPSSNIRIVLDGEEEAGSPSLVPAIAKYRDKLTADVMFILDGPLHPSGRPTLVYGARGNLTLQLTTYGPKFPLHSGHYGNWVPNPAMRLAQLLATMKGDDGKVLVKGFYDGLPPLMPEEQAILDGVPDDPAALQALFGVAGPERPGLKLQEALQYPSFNIRGLSSAFVGAEARTIIPATAMAEIDIRLVKETPAARLHELVVAHIRERGWHVVTADPDDAARATHHKIIKVVARGEGTNAYRTSPLLPISKQVVSSMQKVFGAPPVQIRTSGGTVPIAPFIDALGFPAISVPNVNFDNNQHGENENLRLGHLFTGIVSIAAVLTM
jgi:acetylornithine deacetylase/succinyl-diaminopimelate desuccinylase-like protein